MAPTLAVAPLPKVSAATAAAAPKIAASAPQKSSPGWLEGLINNPYTPLGAVGLMAALAGFGVYRHKKRIKVQSSLFADQLSPQTPGESPEASRFSAAPTEPEHPLTPAPGLDLPDDELTARAYVKDLAMDLDLNLDLDLEPDEPSQPIKPAPTKHPEPATLAQSIDLALPDLDIFTAPEVGKAVTRVADLKPRPPPPSKAPIAPSAPDLSTLDFDIGALSLDLDDASDDDKPTASGDSQDPLETKLALAHEFSAIGDEYGARALIEEVIAEATGTMKTKAERALSQLQGS
jgi:pilus assembly protein FimV